MRVHCIDPANPVNLLQNYVNFFLDAAPDEILAIAENYWRALGEGQRWPAWTPAKTARILLEHGRQWPGFAHRAPGVAPPAPVRRDHLIYAYLIEKTGIFDIFRRASELYESDMDMPTRSDQTHRFWRMADSLIFSAPSQNSVWDLACGTDPDERARRRSLYNTFGLQLTVDNSTGQAKTGQVLDGTSHEFIANFEAFAYEVWRAIVNRNNRAGANDTNYAAIATHGRWMRDALLTRRQRSSLSLEEFRAVGIMSLLHFAVSFNTSIVWDLNAVGNDPAERLVRIGQRVGIAANPNARSLFEVAPVFSRLLRYIEDGNVQDPIGAEVLCTTTPFSDWAATVINLYPTAMGKDLTARKAEVVALPVNAKAQQLFAVRRGAPLAGDEQPVPIFQQVAEALLPRSIGR